MANTLKVRAVEGRLCPHEYSRSFVGYRAAAESDDVAHVIPVAGGELRFARSDDAVEVPNNIYYRRAIAVGDLEQVNDEPARKTPSSAPKKGA